MHVLRILLPIAATFVLGAVLTARPAGAQAPPPSPPGPTGIRVTGQGVVTAAPDVAVVTLGASVRRETAGEAFDRAEQLVSALFAVLQTNGVPERDIQTRDVSLFLERLPPRTPEEPPPPPAWRARYFLTVKLRDFDRIGRVIGEGVAALEEAAELQGVVFRIDNPDPLIARARAAAAANAREKAELLARGLGARLGQLLSAQELFSPTPTPVPVPRPAVPPGALVTASVPEPPPVAPGELSVTVTVEAFFAIEPGPGF